MQPPVVDKVSHVPIAYHLEPDLSSGGQSVVGVVLVIAIAVSILADALPVESLVLKFLCDVSKVVCQFGALESAVQLYH